MKKIKIGFDAFCESFDPENNLIINLLRSHFDVELSGEPDFLFTADFWYGPHRFDLNRYKGVRIGYTGENAGADFNTFDYLLSLATALVLGSNAAAQAVARTIFRARQRNAFVRIQAAGTCCEEEVASCKN